MESKKMINDFIKTTSNVKCAMKDALEKGDIDFLINVLDEFGKASENLKQLLKIEKLERFTA